MRCLVAACCVFLIANGVLADTHDQAPYERVLVPIMATAAVSGAYGSRWVPYLTIRNDADGAVEVTEFPQGVCASVCANVSPRSTSLAGFNTPNANGGIFLYVGNPGKQAVSFALRIQDLSRQSLTWGTTIPVIRDRDAASSPLQILDVPVDGRFRAALRIYDFNSDPDSPGVARVRIYDNHHDAPLVDVNLPVSTNGHAYIPPAYPAFAMIGNLVDAYPQLAGVIDPSLPPGSSLPPRVRIVVEPASPPTLRFWAFVTLTHNETQQVTALLPSH